MAPAPLLPFQNAIVEETHDPATSDLLILARGLGLRKILCTLLKIYDSPKNLVILVNAREGEEYAIGEELGIMGVKRPGLRVIAYEMQKKERQELYRKGGLVSVTSRILIVDLLQGDLPASLITGLMVLHAEKVTPSSLEAFIVRLYREGNTEGFLKAFSDQPESFTAGMFPLKAIMKELHLRKAHIYPRFQQNIKDDLGRRKADIIELHQGLNSSMKDIHDSIVQCMEGSLSELKKSNAALDLDDLNVENAYFQAFDSLVRRQLDPVWHKVGQKTKQLVGDLGTLRRLLNYLLSYDPITFLSYLETIRSSSTNTPKTAGAAKQLTSNTWLMSDAANTMFTAARQRCYIMHRRPNVNSAPSREEQEMDEGWNIMAEMEGITPAPGRNPALDEAEGWKPWMPPGMDPILEELPKWRILSDVLDEIEHTMINQPAPSRAPGTNVTLIMASDQRTCALLREFLSTKHIHPDTPGRHMLETRLQTYLFWKNGLLSTEQQSSKSGPSGSSNGGRAANDDLMSEALKKKDAGRAAAYMKRRRVRGGAPSGAGSSSATREASVAPALDVDPEDLADFYASQPTLELVDLSSDPSFPLPPEIRSMASLKTESTDTPPSTFPPLSTQEAESLASAFDEAYFESHFGLIPAEETIVIRPYGDDGDDQVLAELKPRWIVMFDPNQDFIRRVEIYRSSSPGLAVRLYFLMHHSTSEEHKYLYGLRREKNAFERLINERGSMVLPMFEAPGAAGGTTDKLLHVINSRNAGGQKSLSTEPPRVLVDMREFRSSLPNLLHKAKFQIVPLTLTVGDYILTPDLCVERKSLPDLVQSFMSGRLYAQCELMSVHYQQPILLIEFEENKSFSMQTIAETRVGLAAKKHPNDRTSNKNKNTAPESKIDHQAVQSKLVLLTLAFPRLRIIWSSSPHATVAIIADLKMNNAEPDPSRATAIGADDSSRTIIGDDSAGGINTLAEDLLRSLPGVGTKNYRYVMGKVGSIRELCAMDLKQVQDLLGIDPGKKCFDFLHKGLKNR